MASADVYMNMALEQARQAAQIDEVPVGAVVVLERDPKTGAELGDPIVISQAHNLRESQHNPVAHAELMAIEKASQELKRWRLTGCTLYVTLEPCLMCAGAIILSRLDKVVYGAKDPKAGAVTSLFHVLEDSRLNHRPEILDGVNETECSNVLREFFASKRT